MQDGEKHRKTTSQCTRVRDREMISSNQEIHVTPLTKKLRNIHGRRDCKSQYREQYFLYTMGQLHLSSSDKHASHLCKLKPDETPAMEALRWVDSPNPRRRHWHWTGAGKEVRFFFRVSSCRSTMFQGRSHSPEYLRNTNWAPWG